MLRRMSGIGSLFGSARVCVTDHYAVLPFAALPATPVAGWEKSVCHMALSPALGARFSLFTAFLGADGQCAGNTGRGCYVFYLLEGTASILLDEKRHRLESGSLVVVPPEKDLQLNSTSSAARLLVFQRKLPAVPRTAAVVLNQRELKNSDLPGAPGVKVQTWTPEWTGPGMAFDVCTFQPGASMPSIASDVMESGWYLLSGEGICRLGQEWHAVQRSDALWLAPYCPHWFGALGTAPSVVLVVREVNPDPV